MLFHSISEPYPARIYPENASRSALEAGYRFAAGEIALRLATADTTPKEWPTVSDHMRFDSGAPLPYEDRIRAERFGFAAALGAGMIEHRVDWSTLDPDDAEMSIRLKTTATNDGEGSSDSDSSPALPFDPTRSDLSQVIGYKDLEIAQARVANERWRNAMPHPDYVDAVRDTYNALLEADPSKMLTNSPINADLASFVDGPARGGALLVFMARLREGYPTAGLSKLDREDYIRATHAGLAYDMQVAALPQTRAPHVPEYIAIGRVTEVIDSSKVRFSSFEDSDGRRRFTMHHGENILRQPQPGDEPMIGPRLMCPNLMLSPDNPNITFRPATAAQRPPTGFRSYLSLYMHALINTAAAGNALMPPDLVQG
jgi:hypothetical protein